MAPFELKWGIVSTGRIAMDFSKDLLVDPKTRGTEDVVHKIAGVGSRSTESAKRFIDTYLNSDPSIKAYGSYADLFADQDVSAVYIGTPHTLHYKNAYEALQAGKHVLLEKPSTCNAAELRVLIKLATEKKLFFMEALWTRFQPLAKEVKRIAEESLGDPVFVHADLAFDVDLEHVDPKNRMVNPELGGGALLDLGPYPMIWTILALFEHPSNKGAKPTTARAHMLKTPKSGVDMCTSWTVAFTKTLQAHANLSCSIVVPSADYGATIRYRNGNIIVGTPIFCPTEFKVQYFDKPGSGIVVREETRKFNYVGSGWHFQADEVARCIRDGKLESELWTHEKSLILMEVFDECRYQGNYTLPPGVEKIQLPTRPTPAW